MLSVFRPKNLSSPECQAPLPVKISQPYVALENHSGGAARPRKKFDVIFIRFDTIPVCDGQTRDDSNSRGIQSIARVTRSSADADKPARRVWRSVKVTKHSTIPYVRYSFLLCNSNFVFQTFSGILRYSTSKNVVTLISGQRSLNVIESGNIR